VTWLLCDYGEVLCLAPPAADRAALEAAAGRDGPGFWADYWAHRAPYDRADLTVAEYWSIVLGTPPGAASLKKLIDADVAGWLHPNTAALAATARAAARGLRLALFSNAPVEVAAGIDAQRWLRSFEPRIFSCRLGAVKPEPAAFTAALAVLGCRPEEVVFFDDRPPNVAAARELGLRATLFTDPAQFDEVG
jgi:putative hydrolase of the HAD superfamily